MNTYGSMDDCRFVLGLHHKISPIIAGLKNGVCIFYLARMFHKFVQRLRRILVSLPKKRAQAPKKRAQAPKKRAQEGNFRKSSVSVITGD